jgi:hypothetical protein
MAANQNLFGYMPTESVDWSKALGGLYTTVRGIETDREDLKLELDQLKTDNIKTVQQADNFTSQTFQQMMLGGSQDIVSMMKGWNDALKRGELDPKQYKQKMNNIIEGWKSLAASVKGFDAKNAEIQKQIQDGTLSELSVDAAEYFARASDLKNLQVFADPSNGMVSTGRLDAKTGQVIPDTIESAKTIGDISNAIFPKIDLISEVKKVVDSFGVFVQEDGITTITDATRNPRFAAKLADLTGSLTGNDRYTASILRSSIGDGYKSYYTEQDKQSLLMQAVERQNQILDYQDKPRLAGEELNAFIQEAEGKLIAMKKDSSGVYQPMITDEQRDRAKKAIEDTVYSQLDFKSLQDEPRAQGGGGGSTTVKAEDKPEYFRIATDVRNAWTGGNIARLNSLSEGKYLFEKKGENTYLIIDAQNPKKVFGPISRLDDAGNFFGETNNTSWRKKLAKARVAAKTPAQPAQSNVLSGTKADWKKAGWSDAQINEGIKNGSIKVI